MLIVIEIQTSGESVSTLTWKYDNLADAEAKWHSVLAVAAKSDFAEHGAVILTSSGTLVKSESYRHGGD